MSEIGLWYKSSLGTISVRNEKVLGDRLRERSKCTSVQYWQRPPGYHAFYTVSPGFAINVWELSFEASAPGSMQLNENLTFQ